MTEVTFIDNSMHCVEIVDMQTIPRIGEKVTLKDKEKWYVYEVLDIHYYRDKKWTVDIYVKKGIDMYVKKGII